MAAKTRSSDSSNDRKDCCDGEFELELSSFGIDPSRGFLPKKDPLTELPAKFKAWEEMAGSLPKLLMTNQLRQLVDRLPTANINSSSQPSL